MRSNTRINNLLILTISILQVRNHYDFYKYELIRDNKNKKKNTKFSGIQVPYTIRRLRTSYSNNLLLRFSIFFNLSFSIFSSNLDFYYVVIGCTFRWNNWVWSWNEFIRRVWRCHDVIYSSTVLARSLNIYINSERINFCISEKNKRIKKLRKCCKLTLAFRDNDYWLAFPCKILRIYVLFFL